MDGLESGILQIKIPRLAQGAHGSAPDIAGHDVANPISRILSAALPSATRREIVLRDGAEQDQRCGNRGSRNCSSYSALLTSLIRGAAASVRLRQAARYARPLRRVAHE